ncbi:hypothetical protein PQR67_16420 [Paraburkholderia fungorum]|uniref:hypothetical protein n=1 Tax=Paraburkholderia fungorum TaxID=134537 RepID=UPI0038BA5F36
MLCRLASRSKVVARDLPIVNLVTLKQVTLHNKRVHNHTVTADGLGGNLADVFLA